MKEHAHKLITCILPRGRGNPVLKALKQQHGIIRANVGSARGMGRFSHPEKDNLGQQTEKEILSVVAACTEAEDVFAFLYHKAGIDQLHGGIMYMQPLLHALPFTLPDIPEEVAD